MGYIKQAENVKKIYEGQRLETMANEELKDENRTDTNR
jgi:hypothetical protein